MDEDNFEITIRKIIREELASLIGSSAYSFSKDLRLGENVNIDVGNVNGTRIGTNSGQKLGFYGQTPVAQPGRPTDAASIISLLVTTGLSS